MELSASQYRTFAAECRELIRSAVTPEEKELLREREASWATLAKEAERTGAGVNGKSA
jgi:uncharacterized protein YbjQ (UPF0145 family)